MLTVGARVGAAQQPSATQPVAAPGPWLVAAGVEGFGPLVNRPSRTGGAAQLGYERALQDPRVGLRLSGSYTSRPAVSGDAQNALALNLLGTYGRTSGRVRPYALGGVGIDRSESVWRPSASVGAGALTRVGSAWLFAEVRMVGYPAAFRDDRASERGLLPVTLGVRF